MPDSTPSQTRCPACGAVLDPSDAAGLCVACLLGEAMADGKSAAPLGSIAGHELIEVLARGGMGIVYRARQSDPPREVALKALPGAELMSEEARQRFRIEAQAMARLEHPAIMPVHELGEVDGTPYFTMKLAAGGTLARRIGEYAGKWREIAELIATIAEAVQFAHSRGVLHRDLKPGNILFDEDGHALVSDFGLAKMIGTDSDLTRTLAMMGTPNYMAPEMTHKNGGVTTASDVWSLGVILYELLAGRVPFEGDNVPAVLRAVAEDEPGAFSPEIPRDLGVITLKALQKDAVRRYVTAQEFADDLRRWLAGEPIHARPVAMAERAWLWAKRKPALATALSLLALTLLGSAALLLRSDARLRASNEDLLAVDTQLRGEIHLALVEKADAERSNLLVGRVRRATQMLRESLAYGQSVRARTVAASILSTVDLEEERRWPQGRVSSFDSPACFNADFSLCLQLVPADERIDPAWKTDAFGLREVRTGRWLAQMPVTSLSRYNPQLSPDARYAAVSYAGDLEIWDLRGRTKIRDLKGTPVTSGQFRGSDGAYLAVFGGRLVCLRPPAFEVEEIGGGAVESCDEFSLSPDEKMVALCLTDSSLLNPTRRQVQVRTTAEGALICRHPMHIWGDLEWVRGGEAVLGFDFHTGLLLMIPAPSPWPPPLGLVRSLSTGRRVSMHPDGQFVALGDNSGFSMLRDMHTGLPVLTMPALSMSLKFSADGTHLAFTPDRGHLGLMRLLPPPVLRQGRAIKLGRTVDNSLCISPDGRHVLTSGRTGVSIWDVETVTETWHGFLNPEKTQPSDLSFTHDGKALRFWTSDTQGTTAAMEEAPDGTLTVKPSKEVATNQRSGLSLLSRSAEGAWESALRATDRQTLLWHHGKLVSEVPFTHTSKALTPSMSISPDGRWWALTSVNSKAQGGSVAVSGFQPPHTRVELSDGACHMAVSFSPDSRWLLGAQERDYVIWSVEDWREAFRLPADLSQAVRGSGAFSPDGKLIALEVDKGNIRLLRPGSWEEILTITPPQDIPIQRMEFTPDSRYLFVTGGQILHRWDVAKLQAELTALGIGW